MSSIEQDLDSFNRYARQRIGPGQQALSIDELFEQWRVENSSDDQYAEDVAAINASIQDFKSGERGAPAGEHSAQIRREFGLNELDDS